MIKKIVIIFIIAVFVTIPLLLVSSPVSADEFDTRIATLQQAIDGYKVQAEALSAKARTLQSAVAELQNQAAVIQVQIDINQTKYDQLVSQIADTEKKIQDNKDALGKTIADMYVDDQVTSLEMLAGSKNISEYMDKQEYRSSVRNQLSTTISQIKTLKALLDKQKESVSYVLNNQKAAKADLDNKRQEQDNLLAQTHGDEAVYQQLVADTQNEINKILAAQTAWKAHLLSGYSEYSQIWDNSNCPMGSYRSRYEPGYYSYDGADGNGGDGHGYGCRQCASYAAWRVYVETGNYPEHWGDAIEFLNSASGIYEVGYAPQAHSLAIMTPAVAGNDGQGHVAWVESVDDGGMLTVSQYNANINNIGYGMYSKVQMSASLFYKYIYIP